MKTAKAPQRNMVEIELGFDGKPPSLRRIRARARQILHHAQRIRKSWRGYRLPAAFDDIQSPQARAYIRWYYFERRSPADVARSIGQPPLHPVRRTGAYPINGAFAQKCSLFGYKRPLDWICGKRGALDVIKAGEFQHLSWL